MNSEELKTIMNAVSTYYPNVTITIDIIKSWGMILKDYDYKEVSKKLIEHVKNSEKYITIHDLVAPSIDDYTVQWGYVQSRDNKHYNNNTRYAIKMLGADALINYPAKYLNTFKELYYKFNAFTYQEQKDFFKDVDSFGNIYYIGFTEPERLAIE